MIDNFFVSLPASLVAFTSNEYVPAVVGVPENRPIDDSVIPATELPPTIDHVMGASLVASSVTLYSVPNSAAGKLSVVIVGGARMVMDNDLLAGLPAMLSAVTVKLAVPAAVGVPEILLSISSNPAGRLPIVIDHVIGCVPVAARIWLYALPTAPLGRSVVVISGATGVKLKCNGTSTVLPNKPGSLPAATVQPLSVVKRPPKVPSK